MQRLRLYKNVKINNTIMQNEYNAFDETAIEVVNHWATKYFPICKSGNSAVGVMRDEHLIVVYSDCDELFSIWVDCDGFIEYSKGDCSYINNAAMNIAMALEGHVTVEYAYDEE